MFNKGSSIGYEATHGTSNVLVDLHYFLHATWLLNVLNNAIAYCHIVPYEKGNMPTGFKKYTDVKKNIFYFRIARANKTSKIIDKHLVRKPKIRA